MTLLRNLQDAATALQRRQPAQAEQILRDVLAAAPGNADALRLLGLAQHQRGRYATAAATLRAARSARPDDPVILNDLGNALRMAGDAEAAIAMFRSATQQAPNFTMAWFNLGKALKNSLYPREACVALRRALECDPAFAPAWGSLGDALKACGDVTGAAEAYRMGLRYPSHAAQTWYHLANLQTVALGEADIAALQELLANPALDPDARIYAGYALAKALDDQRQYDAAFATLRSASDLKRSRIRWDPPQFSAHVAAIETAFSAPAPHHSGDPGASVIFVVSLPRSGSTLVEQILAAHSQVEGANELPHLQMILDEESARRQAPFPNWAQSATAADWQRLGADYLARTERWRRNKPRFTDKGIANWQFVGAAVAMLPGARFVNCRRDPLETCFSCYRQLFASGHHYSYDFAELAAYWRDYDRLSRTWLARFPECVYQLIHEQLLEDPETRIRELLAFLDLPFEQACLDFHQSARPVRTASAAQVRQPLQRDTAHAPRYGALLDPLRAALGKL